MKNYLVLYYSKTGNCEFLARKASKVLDADIKKVKPSIDRLIFLFLLSSMKIGARIRLSVKDVEPYDEIVLFGPIWGGQLIAPIRSALKICRKAGKRVHFAVSCETSDDEKNDKYGYVQVLEKAKNAGGGFVGHTEAFTTALIDSDEPKPKLSEKTRITEENFNGEIKERFDRFVNLLLRQPEKVIS